VRCWTPIAPLAPPVTRRTIGQRRRLLWAAPESLVVREESHESFISLIKLTHQGITSIKERPARLDAGKETVNAFGSELKASYLTLRSYDIAAISEAPDDAADAEVALAIGPAGNVTTETLRAFTEDGYRDIVAALPERPDEQLDRAVLPSGKPAMRPPSWGSTGRYGSSTPGMFYMGVVFRASWRGR